MILSFIHPQIQAVEGNYALQYNQEVSAQWVNWRPASWEQNAAVQTLAAQLVVDAGGYSTVPEKIYNWVCENVTYDWEALERGTYSALLPSQVLEERKAVCEGVANLVQAVFLEAGIPCIKVWGAALEPGGCWEDETVVNPRRVNHTWNEFYRDGRWVTVDCTMGILYGNSDYFDPDEVFFARTHQRLRRGNDLPENIPSAWAIPEIAEALDAGLIPLDWLAEYHTAVTEAEWFALTGLGKGRDLPLTRLAAAFSLAPIVELSGSGTLPYSDTASCTEEETQVLEALYHSGIMTGCDGRFFPDAPITRQAAIVVWMRLHRAEE